MKNLLYLLPLFLLIMSLSCTDQKGFNDIDPNTEQGGGSSSDDDDQTTEDKTLNEAIYDKMAMFYLWRDSVKTKDQTNLTLETSKYFEQLRYRVNKSVSYSLDAYGDRFSYIEENVPVSASATRAGATIDPIERWGFDQANWVGQDDEILFIQILFVVPGSPAAKAGLKRGDLVNKINSTNITTSNFATLLAADKITLNLVEYNEQTGTLKSDGERVLTYSSFVGTPLIYSGIVEGSSPKTGYFFYSSFDNDVASIQELKNMFAEFKKQGVENVIVDLRYNPGGYITTSRLISSALTPSASDLNNTVMYQIQSNASYKILTPYKYYGADEMGGLDKHVAPKKLAFIMTEYSASASELTYNSLRPLYGENCVFVGSTTVGKNLGSNAFTIDDVVIHPITARLYNKDGVSGYENGFTPDVEVADIDPEHLNINEIGSTKERMLASALVALRVNVAGLTAADVTATEKTRAQPSLKIKPVYQPTVEYPAVLLDD